MGLGPPILELKQRLRPPIVRWQNFPKKPLREQILGVKIWNLVPIFSKLVNFGPHILASLEGTREGLQDAQILWAKVQKQKSYEGQILRMILIFSKLVNFGPHILTFLESPQEGLQATRILWAKVQKQKGYWVIKFWTLVPIFSKSVNFGPHVSELLEIPQEPLQGPRILWAKVQKQQSCEKVKFWTLVPIFSKPVNFGPDFLTFVERSVNGLRYVTILLAKVQKQQSYASKTLKLWGVTLRGPIAKNLLLTCPTFFRFSKALWTAYQKKIKSGGPGARFWESGGWSWKTPKFRKKFPQNLGLGLGPPISELK